MSIKIINAENHNGFRVIPAKNTVSKQFVLERYGFSYTIIDNGQPHYLNLCRNMSYPFGVEPGYYKANIKGDSIHMQHITIEQYKQCNPQEDKR